MPELPEVETTRRGIAPHLEGQRVSRVIVRDRRLRWPIPEDLDVRLSGQRIVLVERRAKYLLINAEVGTLISHLGMSGNLRLVEVGTPAAKHEHVDIELESGLALRYTDPRRFGAMLWSLDPLNHELLIRLGPEPLTDLFDGERLFQKSRGRSMAVKPFIMDNAVVVGVGNIYATEALFDAGSEQRFCRIDIADTHHHRVVHDERLDRHGAPARLLEQALAIEQIGKRLRPQANQQFVIERVQAPEHRAKPAWVGVTQGQARLEFNIHMLMLGLRGADLDQAQIP